MSNSANDRNMLFGILAQQMDFITRDALIAAMHAWVQEKHKPLGQILLEQKALTADTHALLEALVKKHMALHSDDAEKSLAAVSSVSSVRRNLAAAITDEDIQQSLAHLTNGHGKDHDQYATLSIGTSAGASTSKGVRFRILRPHARGGLGQVYVAYDEELNREVALKEIQGKHAAATETRTRFVLEAEITGGLEHPGIVPVYGLGQYDDGRPFYAMRFIKGDSLKDVISKYHDDSRRDPNERTLELRNLLGRLIDVCQAMQYAHARGILHRDLKPGNIMLGKYGETLVVDWGLAKAMGQLDKQSAEPHRRNRCGLLRERHDGDLRRQRDRHPRLHEPRASRRPLPGDGPCQRRLQPWRHVVRYSHGQSAGRGFGRRPLSVTPIWARFSRRCKRARSGSRATSSRKSIAPWRRFASKQWRLKPAGSLRITTRLGRRSGALARG